MLERQYEICPHTHTLLQIKLRRAFVVRSSPQYSGSVCVQVCDEHYLS